MTPQQLYLYFLHGHRSKERRKNSFPSQDSRATWALLLEAHVIPWAVITAFPSEAMPMGVQSPGLRSFSKKQRKLTRHRALDYINLRISLSTYKLHGTGHSLKTRDTCCRLKTGEKMAKKVLLFTASHVLGPALSTLHLLSLLVITIAVFIF